jgi:hypothetical protein
MLSLELHKPMNHTIAGKSGHSCGIHGGIPHGITLQVLVPTASPAPQEALPTASEVVSVLGLVEGERVV